MLKRDIQFRCGPFPVTMSTSSITSSARKQCKRSCTCVTGERHSQHIVSHRFKLEHAFPDFLFQADVKRLYFRQIHANFRNHVQTYAAGRFQVRPQEWHDDHFIGGYWRREARNTRWRLETSKVEGRHRHLNQEKQPAKLQLGRSILWSA